MRYLICFGSGVMVGLITVKWFYIPLCILLGYFMYRDLWIEENPNLLKPTQTCANLPKPTKTCTNLRRHTQTYTNPHKPTH